MALVSAHCLIFAGITLFLYFLFPVKWQWIVLLAANIYFYCTYGAIYIVWPLSCALISYLAGIFLEKKKDSNASRLASTEDDNVKNELRKKGNTEKKNLSALFIVLALSAWIVIKYGGFILENVLAVLRAFRLNIYMDPISVVIPLGMSFYTFHAVAYIIDVYRSKYPAEKNFLKYVTFMMFFPHLIQGPFSRFNELGKSIFMEHRFSYQRLRAGVARILWGMFKKVVIADALASTVNTIIGNYNDYSSVQILFAMVIYSIRLYADFAGYMDMVCGYCHILGIDLAENFKRPYFSKSIDEFWRRWHISLGHWFRDYLFYPVSMGKNGMKLSKWGRKKWGAKMGKLISGYYALFFVWTVTGLWHGASWNYLIWGYLNLICIMSTMQFSEGYSAVKSKIGIKDESMLWKLLCMARTFLLVSLFRIFSISATVSDALGIFKRLFTSFDIKAFFNLSGFFVGMYREEIFMFGIAFIAMLTVDILQEREKWDAVKEKCPVVLRALWYCIMIVLFILMLKGKDMTQGFMYANF